MHQPFILENETDHLILQYVSCIFAPAVDPLELIYATMQLPKGTHQWSSFLTPEELVLILQRASITVSQTSYLLNGLIPFFIYNILYRG